MRETPSFAKRQNSAAQIHPAYRQAHRLNELVLRVEQDMVGRETVEREMNETRGRTFCALTHQPHAQALIPRGQTCKAHFSLRCLPMFAVEAVTESNPSIPRRAYP